MSEQLEKRYSILVRLKREIIEHAYVRVPVTPAVMQDELDAAGLAYIDPAKLAAEAIRRGTDPNLIWVKEAVLPPILHPVQGPLPDGYPLRPIVDSDWDNAKG